MIGQTISHYKILEKLGEGGMGVVYKAQDTKLDRIVALKFLPHHLTANELEQARFAQEAKAASSLNHPNVCSIHAIGEHEGQSFIDMEFVDGVTLRKKIVSPIPPGEPSTGTAGKRASPLRLDEMVSYAIQIGEALNEAHSKGIVHRDIKCENIMVNSRNQIKVMDFGLAKLKGSLKLTRTSSTVGTLAYMAPEQIQGGEVDARSDIFSFGIVLYELLTGRTPFVGEHEAAMMYSIVNEPAESILSLRPDISPELNRIVLRALEKDPADRYQHVDDMVSELRRVQKQSSRVSRESMQGYRSPETRPATTDVSRPQDSSTVQRPRGNIRWFIASGVGLLLICLIVFVVVPRWFAAPVPFRMTKLRGVTSSGNVLQAALSPDGKYIVQVVEELGKQSLWIRQVAVPSTVPTLPPADVIFSGLTFSPDGNYLYYTAADQENPGGAVFQMPVLGGNRRKITTGVNSVVGVSPDGKQIVFVRRYEAEGEESIVIMNIDGSGERRIGTRKGEDFYLGPSTIGPAWSPDGRTIACAIGSTVGGFHMGVLAVSVNDGTQRPVSSYRWETVGRVIWADQGRGVIVHATEPDHPLQFWYVNYPSGEARPITSDLNDYEQGSLSITADSHRLLAVRIDRRSSIWILSRAGEWDSRDGAAITPVSANLDGVDGLDWIAGRRLVYVSKASGKNDIWVMDRDGRNPNQLTVSTRGVANPSVSPDGNWISYASFRDTTSHLWRMDVDGGNQKQLTFTEDYNPEISPDGKWILYDSYRNAGRRGIWKIGSDGGDPVPVTHAVAFGANISADGKYIACGYYEEATKKTRFAVLDYASGSLVRGFDPAPTVSISSLRWFPGEQMLTYLETRNGISNLWGLPLTAEKPKQLTRFTSDLIFNYSWSRDGKSLALVRGQVNRDIVMIDDVR